MSLSTAAGNQARWPGAENFYGGMDLTRDLSSGKSASEIKAWAAANGDKIRSQVTRDMIAALTDSPSSGGGGGGGGGGGSSAASMVPRKSLFDMGGLKMPDWMGGGGGGGGRGSQVDPWEAEEFVNNGGNTFDDSFNTEINQNAQVDNSFSNTFGDNNVFGAGSMVGNQMAQTMIQQNARGATADISSSGGYASAKERGQKRLNLSNAAFDV